MRDLAARGVLGIAACWFAGRRSAGTRFITPLDCNEAPPLPDESEVDRFRVARLSLEALVRAIRDLPDLNSEKVALFGHSRGGGAALDYALASSGTVAAVALNSAGYPPDFVRRAHEVSMPILMMHGTADAPTDGGSAATAIERARDFEAALRRAGKPVEVKYYEGGRHVGMFTDSLHYRDSVDRVVAFLRAYLSQ